MHFSITTRAKRNGIVFEPHELAPLGIDEGAKCWGVWVEGRGFDDRSRLVTKEDVYKHESPHLAVSPIHPAFWPTAFGLDVYMQRRQFERDSNPVHCDAFLGLSDALRRCDVNILFINTAQLGYDLVCVSLTCDFPLLRQFAATLLTEADNAGREVKNSGRIIDPRRSRITRLLRAAINNTLNASPLFRISADCCCLA